MLLAAFAALECLAGVPGWSAWLECLAGVPGWSAWLECLAGVPGWSAPGFAPFPFSQQVLLRDIVDMPCRDVGIERLLADSGLTRLSICLEVLDDGIGAVLESCDKLVDFGNQGPIPSQLRVRSLPFAKTVGIVLGEFGVVLHLLAHIRHHMLHYSPLQFPPDRRLMVVRYPAKKHHTTYLLVVVRTVVVVFQLQFFIPGEMGLTRRPSMVSFFRPKASSLTSFCCESIPTEVRGTSFIIFL